MTKRSAEEMDNLAAASMADDAAQMAYQDDASLIYIAILTAIQPSSRIWPVLK
jgi:hypothetical protein